MLRVCQYLASTVHRAQSFIKAPLATARAPLRIDAVHLFVCPSVCRQMRTQKRDFLKNKQFRAMVSNDDQWQVPHGLFKATILGPIKFKMVHDRHIKTVKLPYLNEQEVKVI